MKKDTTKPIPAAMPFPARSAAGWLRLTVRPAATETTARTACSAFMWTLYDYMEEVCAEKKE